MKPRVCFFNRSYWPDFGATGQLLTELTQGLVRDHGYAVSVVVGVPLGAEAGRAPWWRPVRREGHEGVAVFRAAGTRFSPRRFAGRVTNYLSYFLTAALAGFMVPRPDVVVCLTDPPIIGLAAYLTARLSGARFVFLCQDIFPEVTVLVEGFHSGIVNRLLDGINRFLLRQADGVVALGETMRARLIRKGAAPGKVTVIHNWADCDALVPGPRDNAFARRHGLTHSFVVMHSGNIGLSQNLDTLLDAAALLRDDASVLFVIVGDGARRRALQARVDAEGLPNVRFLPYQPREALSESFASADVFVISLKEGLAGCIVPSKLYGILAAGRPSIAAVEDECEVAAITREHASGLVVAPGKPGALVEAILTLQRDRALRDRLGANARGAALGFDRPRQIAAYHRLLAPLATPASGTLAFRTPAAKRTFDVALSAVGLALSAPAWLLIAAVVTLQDGGPIFYAQDRVGLGGRRFRSLKFRSMIPDADARFGPRQAVAGDARVTPVGRLLRATAMDELPQLWSIVRGDMSFVGPRALMPDEIEVNGAGQAVPIESVPGYEARHRVVPGLTGLAQIYADRDIPRRHKFRYDVLYIRRRSFWLDLRLIALSFWITARGAWERRGGKF